MSLISLTSPTHPSLGNFNVFFRLGLKYPLWVGDVPFSSPVVGSGGSFSPLQLPSAAAVGWLGGDQHGLKTLTSCLLVFSSLFHDLGCYGVQQEGNMNKVTPSQPPSLCSFVIHFVTSFPCPSASPSCEMSSTSLQSNFTFLFSQIQNVVKEFSLQSSCV